MDSATSITFILILLIVVNELHSPTHERNKGRLDIGGYSQISNGMSQNDVRDRLGLPGDYRLNKRIHRFNLVVPSSFAIVRFDQWITDTLLIHVAYSDDGKVIWRSLSISIDTQRPSAKELK